MVVAVAVMVVVVIVVVVRTGKVLTESDVVAD